MWVEWGWLTRLNQGDLEIGLGQRGGLGSTDHAAANNDHIKIGLHPQSAIRASISSIAFGTSAVRTRGSPSVTRTSSSMRIPML